MATKTKSAFFCTNCGYESPKWQGKCPACTQWNTFVEEIIDKTAKTAPEWKEESPAAHGEKTVLLTHIQTSEDQRMTAPDPELNRVLGGGIVPGSLILVGGEPGIGKSTLFLQMALQMKGYTILYISGEESSQQIKMRADRLGFHQETLYLLTETNLSVIFREIKKLKPQLIIADSIQTLQTNTIDSSAGTVSQIRECASEFQRFAKETNTPVFLIGHITKDGNIAGPKILEHMVDTVLQFEGDRHYSYRILRTLKNRFGSSNELGIYEMHGAGLRAVTNPSEILIAHRNEALSGTAIAATMEGMRPLLIEVQALVTASVYGTPQRTVTGFDLRRLQLLLAVLEKRGGFAFGTRDVFVNIAGGLRIEDPSLDLAVAGALLSSFGDIAVPQQAVFSGEIGLNGEIRSVNKIDQRISEAEKLGFDQIYISRYNKVANPQKYQIEIILLTHLSELFERLFEQ